MVSCLEVQSAAIILGVESFGLVPVRFENSMRRRIDPKTVSRTTRIHPNGPCRMGYEPVNWGYEPFQHECQAGLPGWA
jgi:hypothetical protein